MQLLDSLQRIAHRLAWLKPWVVGTGLALGALAVALILFADPQGGDGLLMTAIAGGLWCLCAWLFLDTLAAVPPAPGAELAGWGRLRRQLARLWYLLLAGALLGLTLAVVSLSQHLLGEALD